MKSKLQSFFSDVKSFLDTPLGRYVIPLSLFVVLFGAPVALFVTLGLERDASSWYDVNWEYKKDITITYAGLAKTDYDVLIEVDTESLIALNKIQADCDDIRIIDSDDLTPLSYWIEGGCNTTTTQIWARVPNLPNGGKTLGLYYGNGSAVNAEETWAGTYTTLSAGSCTAAWPIDATFDNKFPYGGVSYGATSASGHAHSDISCTGSSPSSTQNSLTGTGYNKASSTHTHGTLTGTVSANTTLPPYIDMSFCSSSDMELEAGLIGFFDTSTPAGWTRYAAMDGLLPRGAATPGATGGATSHTHSVTTAATSSSVQDSAKGDDIDCLSAQSHTHGSAAGTSDSSSVEPPYMELIAASLDSTASAPIGFITMVDEVPPLGWTRYSSLDDKFPKGALTPGAIGGTTAHTHTDTLVTAVGGGERGVKCGGTPFARNHTHSCSGSTGASLNIPPYLTVLYAQKNDNAADGVSVALGSETTNGPGGGSGTWYDTDWQYKQSITATNASAGALIDYDLLIEFDTATLIAASKLQADCDDIRLVASDEVTALSYWIEGGCNTATTQIWVRVPNLPVGDTVVGVYYGNDLAINAEQPWTGGFITLNTGACPAGWTLESGVSGDYDDKFPYGAVSYGTPGGALTHLHSNVSCSAGGGSNGWGRTGGGRSWSGRNHIHTALQVAIDNSADLRPPYLDMVYCSNPDSTVDSGQIVVFDAAVPTGWTRFSALDGLFPRGSASYGATGGADTHTHTTTGGYLTGYSGANVTGNYIGTPNNVGANHRHTSGSSTTASGSNLPEYTDVIFGQADTDTVVPSNAILMTSAYPPLGWTRVSGLDGSYVRGGSTYGVTGGDATHTHSVTISTGGPSALTTLTATGDGYSHSQHVHSCSTTSDATANTPPYMETMFVKKNDNTDESISLAFDPEVESGPGVPTIGSPTAQSTTSIRWNFTDTATDEDGFRVYNTSDVIVSTCAVANLTYCDEVGLSANTEYTRKVTAYNGSGESAFSADASSYTLTSSPSVSTYSATTDSITLLASGTVKTLRDYYPPLNTSLANYWPLHAVTDYKGSSDLSLVNSPIYVAGMFGNGMDFEIDSDQYATIADNAELSTGDIDFTISAWVKMESLGNNRGIVAKNMPGSVQEYTLWYTTADFRFSVDDGAGTTIGYTQFDGGSAPVVDAWYHLVAVHDSVNNTVQLYVNGVAGPSNSTTGVPADTVSPFGIGTIEGSYGTFDGIIEEIAFWKRALTPGDVTNAYNNGIVASYRYVDTAPIGGSSVYYDCTSASCDTGLNSWTSDGTDIATGLIANTQYSFQIKGRNGDAVETAYSSLISPYTLANVPDIAVDSITDTSITLSASNTNNVSQGSSGLYFDCTSSFCDGGINGWVQSLTDVSTGLTSNTQYTFRVMARNGDSTETGYSSSISKYSGTATPSDLVYYQTGATSTNFILSRGANPSWTSFAIEEVGSGLYVHKTTGVLDQATASWTSEDVWAGKIISGLASGTSYSFRVQPMNLDGVWGTASGTTSVTTLMDAPTIGTASVVNSGTIRWNFTDNEANEDGFKVYQDSDNSLKATCTTVDLGSCDEIGLSPNTQYTRKVTAYNAVQESPYSGSATAYSGAEVPLAPTILSLDVNGFTAVVKENGNPTGTEYSIKVGTEYVNKTTGALQATKDWGTYVEFGSASGISIVGLTPGAQYNASVNARNSDLVETAYSSGSEVYTRPAVPTLADLSATSTTELSITIGENGNDSSVLYAVHLSGIDKYLDFTTNTLVSGEVWGLHTDFGGASGNSVTSLLVNSVYNFEIKAKNGWGISSSYSPVTPIFTLASAPTTLTLTPQSPLIINIKMGLDGNPSNTNFAILETISGNYVNSSSGVLQASQSLATYTGFGGVNGIGVVGLTPNTMYTFRNSTINGDGIWADNAGTQDIYTLANTPGAPSTSTISTTSINVVLNTGGNPSVTRFVLQEINTSQFVNKATGLLQASEDWGTYANWMSETGVDVIGLSSGTDYEFRVKARNEDLVETSYSVSDASATNLDVPTIGAATVLTASSIRWHFTDNEANEDGFRVYDENDVMVAQCVGQDLTYCDESGLSPNISYTRTVVAYNAIGSSPYSSADTAVTFASVPGAPALTASSSTSINVVIDQNGNPVGTDYLVEDISSGNYLNFTTGELQSGQTGAWGTYTDFGGNSGTDAINLLANAEYSLKVRARNSVGIETVYGITASAFTRTIDLGAPALTATSSTLINVSIDNGGNNAIAQFKLIETNSGKYVDFVSGYLTTAETWGTYADFGSGSGTVVNGLAINAQYSFKVTARNGDLVEGSSSASASIYTLASTPGLSVTNYSANRVITTIVPLGNPTDTTYSITELTTDRYVSASGILQAANTWLPYTSVGATNGLYVSGFTPGGPYRFSITAKNGDGVVTGSTVIAQYALPNAPIIGQNSLISTTSARLEVLRNSNHNSVEFLIKDDESGLFVNPETRKLTTLRIWGSSTELGGEQGLIVQGLDSGRKYTFRARSRNVDGGLSGYGPSVTTQTLARIKNLDAEFLAILLRDSNIDVTTNDGAQLGLNEIRLLRDALLVADIPVQFDGDKDWFDAVIEVDAVTGKTAVSLQDRHGFEGTYTMYVVKGDSNAFLLCPGAEDLDSVSVDCEGSVIFDGPFPQSKDIEAGTVTVSVAVFDGVEYWVIDGLTGTGGQGITITEDEEGEIEIIIENTGDTPPVDGDAPVEEDTSETFIASLVGGDSDIEAINAIVNVVQLAPEAIGSVVKGVQVVLDDTVGDLDEAQLGAVTATTTVATVTVATGTVLGGFSNIPYFITQLFFAVLAWMGFRKEGKPYGYVYDSITKKPISRAVVRIYDGKGGLAWTDVTDSYGSFSADLKAGTYQIVARKTGYIYPSKIVKGKVDHPILDVYHGEKMKLTAKKSVNVAIPLDPKRKGSGKEFMSAALKGKIGYWFGQVHLVLFFFGAALALYTYQKFPSDLNLGVTLLYIPAITLLAARLLKRPKGYGTVVNSKGTPVKGAIVALKEMKFDRYVSKRVTDENGLYRFLVPGGVYQVEVVNDDIKVVKYEGGSNIVDTTSQKSGAVINKNIVVKTVKKK